MYLSQVGRRRLNVQSRTVLNCQAAMGVILEPEIGEEVDIGNGLFGEVVGWGEGD